MRAELMAESTWDELGQTAKHRRIGEAHVDAVKAVGLYLVTITWLELSDNLCQQGIPIKSSATRAEPHSFRSDIGTFSPQGLQVPLLIRLKHPTNT